MYKAKWQNTTTDWNLNGLVEDFKRQFNIDLTNIKIKEAIIYDDGTMTKICSQVNNYYVAKPGDFDFFCDDYYDFTDEQSDFINEWIMDGIANDDDRYCYLECDFVDNLDEADIDNLYEKMDEFKNR